MQKLPPDREGTLPFITTEGYEVKSRETFLYNCIAFAAGDEWNCWWPAEDGYWPNKDPLTGNDIPREITIDAFVAAYRTCEYEICENSNLEPGFDKIAIYVFDGKPTHAAKQLEDGRWKSKLGPWEDIEHNTLKAVEDHFCYGKAEVFMKKVKESNKPPKELVI